MAGSVGGFACVRRTCCWAVQVQLHGPDMPPTRTPMPQADHLLYVINRDFAESVDVDANIVRLVAQYRASKISAHVLDHVKVRLAGAGCSMLVCTWGPACSGQSCSQGARGPFISLLSSAAMQASCG